MMVVDVRYKSLEGEKTVMSFYDAALARWPVAYETVTLPTRHGDTFLIASGDKTAPPLVLLHGSCSNSTAWIGEYPTFCRSFRVYGVDIPGEANKSASNRPDWDSPAYAEWLEDVWDGLRMDRASLLGISLGGWLALKFATAHPGRVERLVLLAPGGVVPVRMSFILRAIPLSLLGRWGARRINQITFGGQPIHEEAVKYLDAIMTHFKARIDKQTIFTDEELRRLTMPALLVTGAKDALMDGAKIAARLEEVLPHISTMVLAEKGHALVDVAENVAPFLTGEELV